MIMWFCLFIGNVTTSWSVEALLAWTPPTEAVDGCPVNDICGYEVLYGTTSGAYTSQVYVTGASQIAISNLVEGTTYYFGVKAGTACQCESAVSEELVWTAPQQDDQDGDSLPDDWEFLYFDGLDDAAGDVSDFDQDGFSDAEEYLAGTAPDRSDDFPVLAIVETQPQTVVGFQSIVAEGPGYENRVRRYTLVRSVSLDDPVWEALSSLENIPATGDYIYYTVSQDLEAGYYRTRIELH
jgi:hypothetical protein